ncbi:hypothetical protein EVAR_69378_1 [Eumeta japonica]|uniref:Uncharacterized protein n=1 Tax=Eumeta variegata TaxID=151549 RepID=A0A4C1ZVN4_EUMVA|nr:hypothetical protein EVAR_69378_1 [Eumeta japonica]
MVTSVATTSRIDGLSCSLKHGVSGVYTSFRLTLTDVYNPIVSKRACYGGSTLIWKSRNVRLILNLRFRLDTDAFQSLAIIRDRSAASGGDHCVCAERLHLSFQEKDRCRSSDVRERCELKKDVVTKIERDRRYEEGQSKIYSSNETVISLLQKRFHDIGQSIGMTRINSLSRPDAVTSAVTTVVSSPPHLPSQRSGSSPA